MKVDFYISSLSSGGAEHVLTNLAANFAEHGEDVSVTSYEKRPQFYSVADGAPPPPAPPPGPRNPPPRNSHFHAPC